jgi:cardiolipin synthase
MAKCFTTFTSVWDQQIKDIESAESTIFFEQYILESFGEDQIGKRFLDALINKAKEGVVVRLIIDAQGSFQLYRNKNMNRLLKQSGVVISYYQTLPASKIISPFRLLLRDHRKILLIDHKVSWIGGVVVGERFRKWQDFMVRYDDLSVADIMHREFRNQLRRLQNNRTLLAPLDRIDDTRYLAGNGPGVGNRLAYEIITHSIMLAKESATLVAPYFAPPYRLHKVIKQRLQDGIKITLLVPKHTDRKWVDHARESYLLHLIDEGLEVRYLPYMNHAKVVVIDNEWTTFGSTNLDAVSLVFNHELNIVEKNMDIVTCVNRSVKNWVDNSEKITKDTMLYKETTLWQKIFARVFRAFA